MKKLIIILLFPSCAETQTVSFIPAAGKDAGAMEYKANWTISNEAIVQRYEIQQSRDKVTWNTIAYVTPAGQTNYSYSLPVQSNYYRVKSTGLINYYTPPVLLKVTSNNAVITNTIYRSTSLTWTVSGEVNVSYYMIEKSLYGTSWSLTTKITTKGNGTYTYRLSRTIRKYIYRVSAVYKDATKSGYVTFK